MYSFLKFNFGIKLYIFRTVPLFIIRSTLYTLYTQQWYKSYRFADSFRAESERNCSSILILLNSVLILLTSCQQTCMTYTIAVCTVGNSWWWNEKPSETCRVLFQNKIWEISASSWFIIRIYQDARSLERRWDRLEISLWKYGQVARQIW